MNKKKRIKEIKEELDIENKKGWGHGAYWNPGKVLKLKQEIKVLTGRKE